MEAARTRETIKQFGDAASGVAGALKKAANSVWKVLTFSPGEAVLPSSCLCAEIRKGQVTILHASQAFSKFRIKADKTYRYGEDSVPSPDEVASALAVAFKDFGIRRADVVLAVPKQWVVVKSASLPAAVGENLGQVVTYEFDRFTPFTSDEALYDYLVEKKTSDKIDLLIAAAKVSTITEYIDKLLERGIPVRRVTFDLSCLATMCRYVTGYDSFLFAEVDRNGIRSGTVDAGMLKAASSSEFGCDDDVLMSVIIEDFLAEQKASAGPAFEGGRTIISFREDMASLKESLKSRGILSFEVLNVVDKKIAGLTGTTAANTSLAGGALEQLWPAAKGFNLISKGFRERAKKPFLLTAFLSVGLVACLASYLFVPIQTEKDRLREIDRQINMRKEEVRYVEKIKSEIEVLSKQIALVNNFRHDKSFYIDMVKELTLVIPNNAWLTRIRIAGSQVNIEGYAPSATPLIQLLEGSKYFQKAEFSSPTFRDARMNMDRFQIKMEMRNLKPEAGANEKK
jgi:general secretion pathway protein L